VDGAIGTARMSKGISQNGAWIVSLAVSPADAWILWGGAGWNRLEDVDMKIAKSGWVFRSSIAYVNAE
jgi:hypothetical protein